MKAARKYTVVSLFSGGMGLDLGLEKTGRFKVVACVEKEHACCETIRANQRAGRLPSDLKIFEGDIATIEPESVLNAIGLKRGDVDVLAGGPPCQSFSTAGKRGTVQDPRGTLLWQYLRFVEALQPRFFLMENVRGLLSAALRHRPIAERPDKNGRPLESDEEPGSVIRLFASDLQGLSGGGYHMDCFEVNAVNYGAPQLRERAIFVGNRFNALVNFPDPTHGPPRNGSVGQQSLFDDPDATEPWQTLGDAIGDLREKEPTVMDFSPRKKQFLSLIPPGGNWRSLPVDIQRESMGKAWFAKGGRSGWWRRLSFDLPCPTVVTMPNHASTSLCHPSELRALSLREYARIQEFPDDWEFCGRIPERYAQAGNAVPLRLGAVAGRVIAAELDRLARRGWKIYATKPEAYRIVYVQSHVRTRQWFKDGETFVWQDDEADNPTYSTPRTKRRNGRL
ncbi:MAG: DNA (cytosine-5-)-methyltransferase [Thermoanaerobaculia bacterium]|nr:DNA (cytosine-5-)-methyltransferase [Thermoanaerobaculia bacterium]